jgi:hypothetical protein
MLVLMVLAGCEQSCRDRGVRGHLGRTPEDYGARYGAAITSPVTPDQIGYSPAQGMRLTVRVEDGRSVEELWMTDHNGDGLPEELLRRARALLASGATPVRTVTFKVRGRPAAEVLQTAAGSGWLQVERRGDQLTRVVLCAEPQACKMLGWLHDSERSTDSLLYTAEQALRRER